MSALTPVAVNAGRLIDVAAVASTAPITTSPIVFTPHRIGMQINLISDQSGTLQRQVFTGIHNPKVSPEYPDAGWTNVGAAISTTGGTMSETVINGAHPPTRFVFTPGGMPHTTILIVESMGG